MFYSYGGATITLNGDAHTGMDAAGNIVIYGNLKVTIKDTYSFADSPLVATVRNLFASYSAANFLETVIKDGYVSFTDTVTFSQRYVVQTLAGLLAH
jgi:hypothetical protein